MPGVKVRKSVLQSIIKKHLFESPAPDSGVSRRLTVGPDSSPLPRGLPLSPTDRMSVQLDTERPPVEDPDYIPENSRELGYAVQALAEMVPADLVEKAYHEFQKVLENLEEDEDGEEDSDENVDLLKKFENFYRRSRKLMREASDDDDFEEDEEELARLDREMGADLKRQADIEFARPKDTNVSLGRLQDALSAIGIKNRNLVDYIVRQIRSNSEVESPSDVSGLTMQEFNEFFDLMIRNMGDRGVVKAFEKAQRDSNSHRDESKWDIMVDFIQQFPRFISNRESELLAHKRDPNEIKQSEYQTIAKPFGYAAASGIRQAFIRDVMAVRALSTFVISRSTSAYVNNSIKEAFEDALSMPENKEFLATLFDEEGLEEYREMMKNPRALEQSDLFKNFAGAVTYEALASVAEMNFKPYNGKPGRSIGAAFMSEFGNENLKLQPNEEMQLRKMADRGLRGDYVQFVEEILETSEENGHRGLLTAAAAMTADDADKDEYGSYASPAFSTMKKAASVSKPPELHVADYAGKDDPLVDKIKSADRAARKASKQAGRNK